MTNLTARLAAIRNRIAARLPGVPGVSLEIGPSADEPVAVLVLFGDVVHATVMLDQCETDDEIIAEALDIIADDGFAVLPEIVLTEDSALTLAGHSLRIAETQTGVSATPRVPVNPEHGYTAELAEADVERVARALADYEPGSPWPDERACIDASRPAAALLLSKLKGWQRGAPPESPGHAYARAVFDAPKPPRAPDHLVPYEPWLTDGTRAYLAAGGPVGPWNEGLVRAFVQPGRVAAAVYDRKLDRYGVWLVHEWQWFSSREEADAEVEHLYPAPGAVGRSAGAGGAGVPSGSPALQEGPGASGLRAGPWMKDDDDFWHRNVDGGWAVSVMARDGVWEWKVYSRWSSDEWDEGICDTEDKARAAADYRLVQLWPGVVLE